MNKQPGHYPAPGSEVWSGEATRRSGFAAEETRVDINIDGTNNAAAAFPDAQRKERPVWMVESTIVTNDAQVHKIHALFNAIVFLSLI
jgi:transcription initiation factor TFIIE subunit alpha